MNIVIKTNQLDPMNKIIIPEKNHSAERDGFKNYN